MDDRAFDQGAVEHILRRATELSRGGSADGDANAGNGNGIGIGEAQLISAAEEAGIPTVAVVRAIAERRLGAPPRARRLDALVGPAVVAVERELSRPADTAMHDLDEWCVNGHLLRRARPSSGGAAWERRGDAVTAAKRGARRLVGDAELGEVRRIEAAATPIGPDASLVRVSADRSVTRAIALGAGAVVGSTGVVGVAAVALVTSPVALAATPVAVACGAAVMLVGRATGRTTRRRVEHLLLVVEHGEQPKSLTQGLSARFRRRADDASPSPLSSPLSSPPSTPSSTPAVGTGRGREQAGP